MSRVAFGAQAKFWIRIGLHHPIATAHPPTLLILRLLLELCGSEKREAVEKTIIGGASIRLGSDFSPAPLRAYSLVHAENDFLPGTRYIRKKTCALYSRARQREAHTAASPQSAGKKTVMMLCQADRVWKSLRLSGRSHPCQRNTFFLLIVAVFGRWVVSFRVPPIFAWILHLLQHQQYSLWLLAHPQGLLCRRARAPGSSKKFARDCAHVRSTESCRMYPAVVGNIVSC